MTTLSNIKVRGPIIGLVFTLTSILGVGTALAEQQPSSGFLDPAIEAKLKTTKLPDGKTVKRWVSSEVNRKNYHAIMVDRVIFYPSPNPGPQISSSTLEAISQHFTYSLRQQMGKKITVVDKAGPGVLRMQPAITAVTVKREGLSAKDVLPVHLLFSAASAASGKMDEDVITNIEVRLTDSMSSATLAAVQMALDGKQLSGKTAQLQLQDLQEVLDTAAKNGAGTISAALSR
jgi:hypothetical protein